ncbi:polyprenyl synthetase family protein [Draconibacterium sp. IB214405]|uniref:polyprenyl synthetase family protein n=1 Tax=Draconibacterium sp. IB214405 TaxID=3097352 RepID=UPI002A142AC0|nr:polyprenyl synthetase family protein [Draconibacterium sp. IB214405]MDX8338638.1 polyprenyl synthetase family protein [Draconibacterium sp. IB214405]
MKETNGILKVPEESFVRNKMRKSAAAMIEKIGLRPPANIQKLEELAATLVTEQEISDEFIPFAMVLLGNESWRKTVKATPMNRRLLLLPQCLNNKEKCEGMFDELGLNCAGCKGCPIDDLLIEAETKGYANLVAEGTTVAVGLVEEGSIDAVIGVSCMPVLQRSFEPVSNAAVPVIGIPLLFDGCEDTRADIKWILDELRSYETDDEHQPISVSLLKNRIEVFFTKENIGKYIQGRDKTEQIAQEYLLIDGQRIRPLLTAIGYLAYSNIDNNELLQPLTLIIECFHKASLIHDDIEDNANQRYNTLTAHAKYGVAQAINAGDFLIGKGYELLSDLDASNETIKNCLRFVSRSHLQLTRGQGVDILFNDGKIQLLPDEMIEVFKNKTGEAIKVALLLGAIVGGANKQEQQILEQFADYMGIAYQIRDDLNEYTEQHSAEKTGDYPFLLSILNKHFADQDKETPANLFKQVAEFRKLIDENGLLEVAKEYLQKYVDSCYAELDKLENSKLRLSLYGVMGKIFKSETTNE